MATFGRFSSQFGQRRRDMADPQPIQHIGVLDDAPRPIAAMARTFDDGMETPFHRHGRGQLLHAVSGIMRIETGEAAWLVPPARALWMPAGTAHRVTMRSRVEMRTLYIDAKAACGAPANPAFIEVGGLMRELILALLEEPLDYDEEGRGGLLARLILTEFSRLQGRRFELPMPRDARALRIARFLLDAPGSEHGLDEWAARAGASRRTLARLFRTETGLSFGEWRARLRAIEGLARLSDGTPVGRAAASVGYSSASAFSAMVRRSLGAAPRRLSVST
jgi:AraC-like DNA-binding protein/quercetin dioxygenase-like cupin family protein